MGLVVSFEESNTHNIFLSRHNVFVAFRVQT